VQRPLTNRPMGWPAGQNPGSANPTLQPLTGRLHSDTLQEALIENLKPKVSGDRTPWPPGHVARPTGHHLVSYRLNQVGNPSLDPFKCPLPVEIYTPHSICSSPLINVLV
jgi:hypothetical protein